MGVGAPANQAQLGEEAGKRVGEAEEHGPDHAGSAELSAERPASVLSRFTAPRVRDVQIELTREGLRHTPAPHLERGMTRPLTNAERRDVRRGGPFPTPVGLATPPSTTRAGKLLVRRGRIRQDFAPKQERCHCHRLPAGWFPRRCPNLLEVKLLQQRKRSRVGADDVSEQSVEVKLFETATGQRFLEGFEAVQALRRGDIALQCLVPGYRPQFATRGDNARAVALPWSPAGLNKTA